MRITLNDIAVKVGITKASVSMALRDSTRISLKRRQEIQRVAAEMGYAPDPFLSSLAKYRAAKNTPKSQALIGWVNHYTLYIYQISGTGNTNATLIYSSAPGQALNLSSYSSKLWLTWSGLNVALQPNTMYAYTIWNNVGNAYEEIANQSGQPYTNGQICLIPPAGGLVTYGNGGASYSDATFDVGLAIPQIPIPQTPTYTPNVSPIYAGSTVIFNENASGPGPLYYQWITDGGTGGSLTPIGGATSTNLAVNTTSFTPGNIYNYAVIVTNSFGSATSSVVALIITNASAPIITANSASPNTTTNFVGLSETYTVAVVGTLPISYQWQVSTNADGSFFSNISGATNLTLVLTNLQTTNTGYYSLLATNVVSPFTTNSPWTSLTVVAITNEFITWSNPVSILGLTAGQILTNPLGTLLGAEYFGPNVGPITVTVTDQSAA
jgi:hypothetical protein